MKEYFEDAIQEWKNNNIYFEDIIEGEKYKEILDRAIRRYFSEIVIDSTINSLSLEHYTTMDTIINIISGYIKDFTSKEVRVFDLKQVSSYLNNEIHSYHNCIPGFKVCSNGSNVENYEFRFRIDRSLLRQ